MNKITPSTVYYISEQEVSSRIIDNEAVILNLENGEYYSLNKIGTRIWNLIDGINTVENIIEKIYDEYNAEKEKISLEVNELIIDLNNHKLILKKD